MQRVAARMLTHKQQTLAVRVFASINLLVVSLWSMFRITVCTVRWARRWVGLANPFSPPPRWFSLVTHPHLPACCLREGRGEGRSETCRSSVFIPLENQWGGREQGFRAPGRMLSCTLQTCCEAFDPPPLWRAQQTAAGLLLKSRRGPFVSTVGGFAFNRADRLMAERHRGAKQEPPFCYFMHTEAPGCLRRTHACARWRTFHPYWETINVTYWAKNVKTSSLNSLNTRNTRFIVVWYLFLPSFFRKFKLKTQ